MKTIINILAFSLLTFFMSCGPTIYKSTNFEKSRENIKTLAILPFNVSIDTRKLPKGVTIESVKESEVKTGYEMQSDAYTWLLQKQGDFTAKMQDVDKTNSILQKANITYADISTYDKVELCTVLGVDGLITGKATLSKPISEGAAVAVGLLGGAWVATNSATTSLSIYDASGELLWKYDYQASGSVGSSAESLTHSLMKNASKHFPYKKPE